MPLRSRLVALAATAGATGLALGLAAPWAATASAQSTSSVTAWVMAWRQDHRTLLVAYRPKNTTASAVSATCNVKVKPSVKIAKPGYYTLKPAQHFHLPASGKQSWIGVLSLPKLPAGSHVAHVWASCS